MGQEQKGPIEQSGKKLKKIKDAKRESITWWHLRRSPDKTISSFLSDDVVDFMRQKNHQQVANILLKKKNQTHQTLPMS